MARWRVSIDVGAGERRNFHTDATIEAETLEGIIDQADDPFDGFAARLEDELDVADVTLLQLTVERLP